MAKGKYQKWLEPDSLILLEGWARDGLTDEQIAHNMGVAYSTLKDWKNKYPAISAALKKGKEVVDIEVENALLKSALGFKETIRKPFKVREVIYENGKRCNETEHIEVAEEEIFIPPNVTAMIYWLKNRCPDKWRDKPADDKTDATIKVVFEDTEGENYAN